MKNLTKQMLQDGKHTCGGWLTMGSDIAAEITKGKLAGLKPLTKGKESQELDAFARELDLIISKKASGKTIFVTTHNMHDADELCDRISFIADGEIMVTDTPKNLKREFGRSKIRIEYADEEKSHSIIQDEFPLKGLGKDKAFLDILKSREIISIHSQEASLDEVFIQVTGRHLI